MKRSGVFSFSVRNKDEDGKRIVEILTLHSIRSGVKFSFMVIAGLKLYAEQEKINVSKK